MKTKKIISSVLIGSLTFSLVPTNISFANLSPAEEKLCSIQGNVEEIFSDKKGNLYTIFNKDLKITYKDERNSFNSTKIPEVFLTKNGEVIGSQFNYIAPGRSDYGLIQRYFFSKDGRIALPSIALGEINAVIDGVKTTESFKDFFEKNSALEKFNFKFEETNRNWDLGIKTFAGVNYRYNFLNNNIEESECKADLQWKKTKVDTTDFMSLEKISNSGSFYFVPNESIGIYNGKRAVERGATKIFRLNKEKTNLETIPLNGNIVYIDDSGNFYSYENGNIYKNNNIFIKDYNGFEKNITEDSLGGDFIDEENMIQEKGNDIYFLNRIAEEENANGIKLKNILYKNGEKINEFSFEISKENLEKYFNFSDNPHPKFKKGDESSEVFLQDYIDYNGNLYTYSYTGSVKEIFKNGNSLCEGKTQNVNPNPPVNPVPASKTEGFSSTVDISKIAPKNDPRVNPEESEEIKKMLMELDSYKLYEIINEITQKEYNEKNEDFHTFYLNIYSYEYIGMITSSTQKLDSNYENKEFMARFVNDLFEKTSYGIMKKIYERFKEDDIEKFRDESKIVDLFVEEYNSYFNNIENEIDAKITGLKASDIQRIKDRIKNIFKNHGNEVIKKVHNILKNDLDLRKSFDTSLSMYMTISYFSREAIYQKIVDEDITWINDTLENEWNTCHREKYLQEFRGRGKVIECKNMNV